MSKSSVVWTARARASLLAITTYIAEHDQAAAIRLVDNIVYRAEAQLSSHPDSGRPGRVENTRELVVHKNYVAAYRLTKAEEVQILDVIHAARMWPGSL